jgi:uncharacterized protein (TIGR03435 family)
MDDARAMLRTLLADRFKFRVHHETKEMQVYALVVGKHDQANAWCMPPLAGDGRNSEVTFSNCPVERLAD